MESSAPITVTAVVDCVNTYVAHPGPLTQAPIPMFEGDKEVDIVLFIDNSITETFFMQGRSRHTNSFFPGPASRQLSVFSSAVGVTLLSLDAWPMENMWLTPEDVMRTWKPYNGPYNNQ